MDPESGPALRAVGLTKQYQSGAGQLKVLDNLSFDVQKGESLALTGESGAGKTTLLHLLGGLDRPTTGSIFYGNTDISALDHTQLAHFRNTSLGFVWQQSSLLPEFTALENVAMPLRIRGEDPDLADKKALEQLDDVGLKARATHRAGELSGGEQQRVALARALVTRPQVLLADEPTGNLDNQTGEKIISLLGELHQRYGLTSVIVTHNPEFASRCDRTFFLGNGRISGTTMEGKAYV